MTDIAVPLTESEVNCANPGRCAQTEPVSVTPLTSLRNMFETLKERRLMGFPPGGAGKSPSNASQSPEAIAHRARQAVRPQTRLLASSAQISGAANRITKLLREEGKERTRSFATQPEPLTLERCAQQAEKTRRRTLRRSAGRAGRAGSAP